MKEMKDIIDYKSAPLSQWEVAIDDVISDGKKLEDRLTHTAIAGVLNRLNVQTVTGIIADEARFELAAAAMMPRVKALNHLTLSNTFAAVARNNVAVAQKHAFIRSDFVRVTTDADTIMPKSQDAVVMNMIFGCLATAQDHDNLQKMLCFVATLLKPEGALIMVRPNPAGGAFPTYSCTTPACDLEGGKDYNFIVKGLEDLGEMQNLHTPFDFVASKMAAAGFNTGPTENIFDEFPAEDSPPPFLLNVCTLKRN